MHAEGFNLLFLLIVNLLAAVLLIALRMDTSDHTNIAMDGSWLPAVEFDGARGAKIGAPPQSVIVHYQDGLYRARSVEGNRLILCRRHRLQPSFPEY